MIVEYASWCDLLYTLFTLFLSRVHSAGFPVHQFKLCYALFKLFLSRIHLQGFQCIHVHCALCTVYTLVKSTLCRFSSAFSVHSCFMHCLHSFSPEYILQFFQCINLPLFYALFTSSSPEYNLQDFSVSV